MQWSSLISCRYCAARGLELPDPRSWAFYLALSLFRLLAILAGVQARSRQGNASSARAAVISSDAVLASLASAALGVIGRVEEGVPLFPNPEGTEGPSGAFPMKPLTAKGLVVGVPVVSPVVSLAGGTSVTGRVTTTSSSSGSGDGGRGGAGGVTGGSLGVSLGAPSAKAAALVVKIKGFMDEHVYPNEAVLEEWHSGPNKWKIHPLNEKLKEEARRQGLWNLWLPAGKGGRGSWGMGLKGWGGGGAISYVFNWGMCGRRVWAGIENRKWQESRLSE